MLCRWKGSVYKLVWIDSVVYFCLYFLIAIIYHVVLQDERHKRCDVLFLCVRSCACVLFTFVFFTPHLNIAMQTLRCGLLFLMFRGLSACACVGLLVAFVSSTK